MNTIGNQKSKAGLMTSLASATNLKDRITPHANFSEGVRSNSRNRGSESK